MFSEPHPCSDWILTLQKTFALKLAMGLLLRNYSRYFTVHCAEMLALPKSKPEVNQGFNAEQFSVQLSCLNPFGRMQATEVTVNKDTQTPGGTTGFSLKPGVVQWFYMTAEC